MCGSIIYLIHIGGCVGLLKNLQIYYYSQRTISPTQVHMSDHLVEEAEREGSRDAASGYAHRGLVNKVDSSKWTWHVRELGKRGCNVQLRRGIES